MNRRNDIRYIISEFPVKEIGTIIEISKAGMKIKKLISDEIEHSELTIPIVGHEIKAAIIWQDKHYMGLRYGHEFDIVKLVKKITKKIKEPEFKPKKIISNAAIAAFSKKDALSSFVNLIAELENPDTDTTKLQSYVEEISNVCRENIDQKKSEEPESMGDSETGSHKPANLDEILIHKARAACSGIRVEIRDAGFAIATLGLDAFIKIATDFIHDNISELEISLSNFGNYESYHILKTVIFKQLTHFFNFNDAEGEGSLLMTLETKGIDILMSVNSSDSKDIKDYYISPQRIYSEISRIYEKKFFGKDLLLINKYHFEIKSGMFEDLYDGYILAHLTLNPFYTISSDIKFILTKRKLVFSFLAYLTIITTKFILDKDKEGGNVLIHKLRRTGMDEKEIMVFLNERINEANHVLKNLGLHGKINSAAPPHSSFKIEGYFAKNIRSNYFMKSWKDFNQVNSIKRMAIRYEDEAYAHFILNKFMIADDFGFKSSIYCVIPCQNISHDELYLEDFSFFDLLIFKDIDSLPISHMKEFIKLWNRFEGKIIVTFSNYSFLDFEDKDLYLLLKAHIVDFPSYFSNQGTYEKMVDHTINYLNPYIGGKVIDKTNYLQDVFSMDYIKLNELQSYV